MRTLRIDVSDSIYEHIIFFLKSLPNNLINISDEKKSVSVKENGIKQRVEELFRTHQTITPFQTINDPVEWQKSMRDEWE